MSRSLKFHEIFQLEIEGWKIGLKSFKKDFTPQHMHAIIAELKDAFRESLRQGYAFNIVKIANEFASIHKVNSPKEVAFIIIASLPKISELSGIEAETLNKILEAADSAFGGVYQRFGGTPDLSKNFSAMPKPDLNKSDFFKKNSEISSAAAFVQPRS